MAIKCYQSQQKQLALLGFSGAFVGFSRFVLVASANEHHFVA